MGARVAVIVDGSAQNDVAHEEGLYIKEALERSDHEVKVFAADLTLTTNLRSFAPDVAINAAGPALTASAAPQTLLELLDIPYVGTNARMSPLASDKANLARALEIAAQNGPVQARAPLGFVLSSVAIHELGASDALDVVAQKIPSGFPFCVKPCHGFVSQGATKVQTQDELIAAVKSTADIDSAVLVQQWVDGVEVSVIVAGDEDDIGVLPPVELEANTTVQTGAQPQVAYHVPVRLESLSEDAEIAQDARSQIERDALDAFYACGARDIACINLIWDGVRSYVLEMDIAPVLAPGSIFDRALTCAGLDTAEFFDELVANALNRG